MNEWANYKQMDADRATSVLEPSNWTETACPITATSSTSTDESYFIGFLGFISAPDSTRKCLAFSNCGAQVFYPF
jgi:hypothetical protein